MYQLPCQSGPGTAQAGPGGRDLPAVRGGSGGVSRAQDGTAPGAPAGATRGRGRRGPGPPAPLRRPKPTLSRERRGARAPAPLGTRRELGTISSQLQLLEVHYVPFRAGPGHEVSRTAMHVSLGVWPRLTDWSLSRGGKGRLSSTLRNPVCGGCNLRKCFAPFHCLPAG